MSTKRPRGTTFTTDHKSPTSDRGFTLIELLIVVAIIAILISIGLTSYSQAQRQGRDSKRKGDLATVANALEQFYSDNNRYPITETGGSKPGRIKCLKPDDTWNSIDWRNESLADEEEFVCDLDGSGPDTDVVYFGFLPGDPQVDQLHPQYFYEARTVLDANGCSSSACQRFILAAVLENPNDSDIKANCFISPGGVSYNYCVYNP